MPVAITVTVRSIDRPSLLLLSKLLQKFERKRPMHSTVSSDQVRSGQVRSGQVKRSHSSRSSRLSERIAARVALSRVVEALPRKTCFEVGFFASLPEGMWQPVAVRAK